MDRFQSNIQIDAPAGVCYQTWHQFEQFPNFMTNVRSVNKLSDRKWHWVVTGPLGNDVEWDAEIDGDEPNKVISWHSVKKPDVGVQGAIRFDEIGPNKTDVTCTIQYEPPGGILGEAVTHLLSHPKKMVDTELANFKHLVEGTNVPSEKVHTGKVLSPNQPVAEQRGSDTVAGFTVPASVTETEITDYETNYGLEEEIPPVGTSSEILASDVSELQQLRDEEEPYLGADAALYSEDDIDMRADQQGLDENDVFTESLDIQEEDLSNYTEDMDDEIDIGMAPRDINQANDFDAQERRSVINPGHVGQDR